MLICEKKCITAYVVHVCTCNYGVIKSCFNYKKKINGSCFFRVTPFLESEEILLLVLISRHSVASSIFISDKMVVFIIFLFFVLDFYMRAFISILLVRVTRKKEESEGRNKFHPRKE